MYKLAQLYRYYQVSSVGDSQKNTVSFFVYEIFSHAYKKC